MASRADLECAGALEVEVGVVTSPQPPHACKILRTGKCLGIAVLFGLAVCASPVAMPSSVGAFFLAWRPMRAVNKSDKLRVHETFSAADATGVVPDVSVASEEVGALLQEVELQDWREDPAPPTPESAPKSSSFWPWFNGLTKYKRGSYADAAKRIKAYQDSHAQEPESTFWPWFSSLTKYKRGSYSDAAARIRAYRAAQVKVVLDDAVVDQ